MIQFVAMVQAEWDLTKRLTVLCIISIDNIFLAQEGSV